MTKNWSDFFQQIFRPPETVAEAVDRLMSILEGEHKIALAVMSEQELTDLHFSFGLGIRNAFGLHEPGSQLLASCGVVHPDDASERIIRQLWQCLRQ